MAQLGNRPAVIVVAEVETKAIDAVGDGIALATDPFVATEDGSELSLIGEGCCGST